MRAGRICVLLVGSIVCVATAARAQDKPKLGITMETPSRVGVIWHISNAIAIQPEIGFSKGSSEGERSNTDQSGLFTGVGVRVYVHTWDNLRAYVSPRYSYDRLTQQGGSSSLTLENTNTTNSFTGSFGAQYALHKRFAVYAQTGVTYSSLKFKSTSTIASLGSESTNSSWRSGSSVGAAFYLW